MRNIDKLLPNQIIEPAFESITPSYEIMTLRGIPYTGAFDNLFNEKFHKPLA